MGQNSVSPSDCRISNQISLEQSDEIVYFFTCWSRKLRVDRKILGCVWSWKLRVDIKILGCVWSEMVIATLVTRLMGEWMNWGDFSMLIQIKNFFTIFGWFVVKNGHGTLISEWMDESNFLHANIFKKAKLLNSYWVGMVKYGCVLLGHGTL